MIASLINLAFESSDLIWLKRFQIEKMTIVEIWKILIVQMKASKNLAFIILLILYFFQGMPVIMQDEQEIETNNRHEGAPLLTATQKSPPKFDQSVCWCSCMWQKN